MHHFKAIDEFKLELQFRNTQFGSKLAIFCPVGPWNMTDDLEKQYGTSSILHQALCIISKPSVTSNWSYSPETLNLGQNWWFFVSCDLEIWRMTLKNNRAPLLCYFKLHASFDSHQWIQTRVIVWKCLIRVKIDDLLFRVTLKFDKWLEIWWMILKNNRAPLLWHIKLCASFHRLMWIQTASYGPQTVKLSFDLLLWPLTLTFCMDITLVNGNHSWKFHDDMITEALSKRCDGQTDGRTD